MPITTTIRDIHLFETRLASTRKNEPENLLIEPKVTSEKDDAESANEEYKGAAGHLIDGNRCVYQTNIH